MAESYVGCPNGCGALITEAYVDRYGQCRDCYERQQFPLGLRIQRSL